MIDTQLGFYQIIEQIGAGGMGTVYRAAHATTGQIVALKLLKPELVAPEMIARFNREADALRQLNHPNIVKVLDSFNEDGVHCIVMEYMSGGSLYDLLKSVGVSHDSLLDIERVLSIALELADALTRAHHLKIIHRDLKPANVLIADDGTPRLTDFGVAYLIAKERITESGMLVGTPDYLPPETLNGDTVDVRVDLWAFGVMLFEMLAGRRPFAGENIMQVITAILTQPTPDLEALRPDCPVALIDLVYRMLEKDQNARISSARLVGAELEAIQKGASVGTPYRVSAQVNRQTSDPFATPTPTTDAPKHNLPAQTTPFVGREAELSELRRLLDDGQNRLVTILAPGGMGKTRLVLETATAQLPNFVNGVYFVALAPITSADNVIPAIADAVNFQFYPGGEPRQQLLDFFREKQLLLVMDNFEHVLDGVDIIAEILAAAPHVKILATSRERLNLSGETLFVLDGLDFPDWETPETALEYSAVKLFMQGARRAKPGFELRADDLPYVARICRQVQGMPLGIVLAAAWVESLAIKEISDEISQSIDFLETDLRDVPTRQRSIRAVFEYSWNLLSEAERDVFIRFAVFRGGFTRQAAQAVAGANLRTLTSLVNKSLLRRDPNSGRYDIHELLRQYTEERLENSGDTASVGDAHSTYYLNALHQRRPELEGGGKDQQLNAINDIATDMDNVRVALIHAAKTMQFRLIIEALPAIWIYVFFRGLWVEGEALLDELTPQLRESALAPEHHDTLSYALSLQSYFCCHLYQMEKAERLRKESEVLLSDSSITQAQAMLAFAGGLYHIHLMKPLDARSFLERALMLYQKMEDHFFTARSYLLLGMAHWSLVDSVERDLSQAEKYLGKAQTLMEAAGNWMGLATVTFNQAAVVSIGRRYTESNNLYRDSLVRVKSVGNQSVIAAILGSLGINAQFDGKYTDASTFYKESLVLNQKAGIIVHILACLGNLGFIYFALGDFDKAEHYFGQYMEYVNDIEQPEQWVQTPLFGLGEIAWGRGRYDEAAAYFQRYDDLNSQLGSRNELSLSYGDGYFKLGELALRQRKFEQAHDYFEQALQIAQEFDLKVLMPIYHLNMGWLAYEESDFRRAKEFFTINLNFLRSDETSHFVDVSLIYRHLAETLQGLGDIERVEENYDMARQHLHESLRLAWRYAGIPRTFMVVAAWADLFAAEGQPERAAELAALVQVEPRAFAISKERAARLLENLQTSLSSQVFTAAVERGQALDLETIVKQLLEETPDDTRGD